MLEVLNVEQGERKNMSVIEKIRRANLSENRNNHLESYITNRQFPRKFVEEVKKMLADQELWGVSPSAST